MATGPNWAGLDKGFLVESVGALATGQILKLGTAAQTVTNVTAPVTATELAVVCMEDVDATKVATGKVYVNCRMGGIAPVRVGTASLPKGTRVINNAAGQVVAAGAAGTVAIGVLLETGGAVGTLTEVLLTPGVTV